MTKYGLKFTGPSGPPGIDFTDWSWGEIDLDQGTVKVVADRVAEVLFTEITETVTDHHAPPYLSVGMDDEPEMNLTIAVLDDHFVVIPLSSIELDTDCMFIMHKRDGTEGTEASNYVTDWPATIAAKQAAIELLNGWIAKLQETIELDRTEQAKEASR
jgi:hypothetical protein